MAGLWQRLHIRWGKVNYMCSQCTWLDLNNWNVEPVFKDDDDDDDDDGFKGENNLPWFTS